MLAVTRQRTNRTIYPLCGTWQVLIPLWQALIPSVVKFSALMILLEKIFGFLTKTQNQTRMLNTLMNLEIDIFTTQPTSVLFT